MKSNKLKFLALLPLAMLSSCFEDGLDETVPKEIEYSDVSIDITTSVESSESYTAGKGTPITDGEDVSSIGIYGYLNEYDANDLNDVSVLLDNSEIKRNVYGSLEFVNIAYWPVLESTERLGFVAYSPYTDVVVASDSSDSEVTGIYNVTSFSKTEEDNYDYDGYDYRNISLVYNVPTLAKDQPDLLVSYPVQQTDGAVPLTFRHALATIVFKVTGDGVQPVSKITITDVACKGTMTAEYSLTTTSNSSGYDGGPVWTLHTDEDGDILTKDFSVSIDEGDESISLVYPDDDLVTINTDSGYMMMIPQLVSADSQIVIEFTDGETRTVQFLDELNWVAGGLYNYNINIDFEGRVIDLSSTETVNELVNNPNGTELETANCYILNPPIYTKAQEEAADELRENGYEDSLTDGITETIYGALYYIPITTQMKKFYEVHESGSIPVHSSWTPDILWYDSETKPTDAGVIIKRVDDANDQERFSVYIPYGYNNFGNMSIGVSADSGEVIWSWHLWITDYNPYYNYTLGYDAKATGETGAYAIDVEGGELHHYRDSDHTNEYYWSNEDYYRDRLMMDRNLGAMDSEGSTYDADDRTPGLFYQYGRKDPFPRGPSNYSIADRDFKTSWTTTTILLSIKNPVTFYGNTGNWCSSHSTETTYVWGDKTYTTSHADAGTDVAEYYKSLFDPSPIGFMVPTMNVWNGFVVGVGTTSTNMTLASSTDGMNYKSSMTNLEARYPMAASLYSDGNNSYVGTMQTTSWTACWAALSAATTCGRAIYYNNTGTVTQYITSGANYNYKATGNTVRPIQRWYGTFPWETEVADEED